MAEQIEGSQEWDIVKGFETKLYALSGGKCLSKLNAGDVDENGLCAWLIWPIGSELLTETKGN